LTLWYTGVLALVLIVFAVVTYHYLERSAQQRTDRSLADASNAFISTLLTEMGDENQTLEGAAKETAGAFHFPDRQVFVYDRQHQELAASALPETIRSSAGWFSPGQPALAEVLAAAERSGVAYTTINSGGIRVLATNTRGPSENVNVVMAGPLKEQLETLEQARRSLYLAVPLSLLLASLGGYFLARKSLAPVLAMSNRAAQIGVNNLAERLPVPHSRNELSELAQIFNELLARLDGSFSQQRRFMADASHELRTPVAIVCGESEVALAREQRTPEEYRQALEIVHDEGRRLTRLVEDLFTLARADAGQYPLVLTNLYLDETVSDCARSLRSVAMQRGLDLHCEPPPREMPFRGDEGLLRRMVQNLLDNSLKHTAPGGHVRISLGADNQHYSIKVTDSGAGIPAGARAHVFERFFRVDKSRSRNDAGGGAGLGLSIAAWIAEMHGGRIALGASDQNGTTFTITIPSS
jgi:two-component system, OmpR family, sensor kinase